MAVLRAPVPLRNKSLHDFHYFMLRYEAAFRYFEIDKFRERGPRPLNAYSNAIIELKVEHPCHHCGSAVEDTSPFCSNCGAAQVRFAKTQVPAEAVLVKQAMASLPLAVEPMAHASPPPQTTFRNKSAAFRSAASAALVGALLSILPFGFVLALPLAGFLSVLFFRRRTWGVEASPRDGFRLGLLTGALGFGMFVVLAALDTVVSHGGEQIRQAMIEAVHRQQARTPDPQARHLLDYFLTQQGLAVIMIAGLVCMCIAFALLAGIGGAVSASLLRRKGPEN